MKKRPNTILYIIAVLLLITYFLPGIVAKRLRAFDGYYTAHTGAIIFVPLAFLALSLFFLSTINSEKITVCHRGLFSAFALLALFSIAQTGADVYPHFENSYLLRNTRFETRHISPAALENAKEGDYIIYAGEDGEIYDYLNDCAKEQPLQIHYCEVQGGEKIPEELKKYGVEKLPAVVYITGGEAGQILYGDDIIPSFGYFVHQYKVRNTFFNKPLPAVKA